jgi:hypothetical protein
MTPATNPFNTVVGHLMDSERLALANVPDYDYVPPGVGGHVRRASGRSHHFAPGKPFGRVKRLLARSRQARLMSGNRASGGNGHRSSSVTRSIAAHPRVSVCNRISLDHGYGRDISSPADEGHCRGAGPPTSSPPSSMT